MALKQGFFCAMLFVFSSCQMTYYVSSAYEQFSMLAKKTPNDKALSDSELTEEQKRKIRLASSAKAFAEEKIGLKKSKNYSSFVNLKRDSVTWVVNAAEPWQIKNYEWDYFWVGKMPYKGFFSEDKARLEENRLKSLGLDTYLRGVSAYSTLGWLSDPIVSPMLKYSDVDLVETIIHELVHVTIYIKNSADFNERLAVFVGQNGAIEYFKQLEGEDSTKAQMIIDTESDSQIFSQFISKELELLNKWYELNQSKNMEEKTKRLAQIQSDFTTQIKPQLKTDSFDFFARIKLNNARLGLFKTYNSDLSDFSKLFEKSNRNYAEFFKQIKSLENAKDPSQELKKILAM